jgi:hypothetical protein
VERRPLTKLAAGSDGFSPDDRGKSSTLFAEVGFNQRYQGIDSCLGIDPGSLYLNGVTMGYCRLNDLKDTFGVSRPVIPRKIGDFDIRFEALSGLNKFGSGPGV